MNRQAIYKALLALAACLALVFAIHRMVTRASGEDPAPTDQFVAFHCLDCDRDFDLSHRDVDNALKQGTVASNEHGHGLLFRCPHCEHLRGARQLGNTTPASPPAP